MSDSNSIRESTITLQLESQHYQLLEEAATLTGLSVTDYIVHHALSAAIAHTAIHNSSHSPQSTADAQSTPDLISSLLDNNPQDLNNVAKAILSTLAWSSPEILQKSKNSQ
ncbi:MAG: DUF1778 domain-containing protein [Roseofilum sp. SBFL]|uniref:type II toxin -antitoxin system TacA 1-like antitoxin n=1 Tax=unclassified Roseofilum TaxID=2620099 RepID=UPI001B1D472B|nr:MULTISPECIES: DUF1778 domain-containing protein [unclassified Roseofilum]MBP0013602.1 DUF1778 domain-containing protein [Roseofilum sp. SID3]MBP0026748.1 DUF1778 domain-containing protein [Roseofilum sp. SID2]MBP0039348.1 DUF1778 domain-containing protein [Roseofilum sp. SID1]MBP0041204.1 DUF1778 domain-containing protein [Roseofilum sp. SBFL]